MNQIVVSRNVNLGHLPFPASSLWDGSACTISADVDQEVLAAAVDRAGNWKPPLDSVAVSATLNAVLGLWPLTDAANAVGLTPEDLIAEAEAWAAAAELGGLP